MTERELLTAALGGQSSTTWDQSVILIAARKRLALLPESCEHGFDEPHSWAPFDCSGKVYSVETVDRLVTAAFEFDRVEPPGSRGRYERMIVALLDALTRDYAETPT